MSNLNTLNLRPGDRVFRMIVDFRGARICMASHALRAFQVPPAAREIHREIGDSHLFPGSDADRQASRHAFHRG